jgi:hypothetical protein
VWLHSSHWCPWAWPLSHWAALGGWCVQHWGWDWATRNGGKICTAWQWRAELKGSEQSWGQAHNTQLSFTKPLTTNTSWSMRETTATLDHEPAEPPANTQASCPPLMPPRHLQTPKPAAYLSTGTTSCLRAGPRRTSCSAAPAVLAAPEPPPKRRRCRPAGSRLPWQPCRYSALEPGRRAS